MVNQIFNRTIFLVRPNIFYIIKLHVQSNPAISNSVNLNSPLFRAKIEFPLTYPNVFQSFTVSYFKLVYIEFPAILNSLFFPYILNQPRYFELVKNRVQEETSKRPMKSEVKVKLWRLSHSTVFLLLRKPRLDGKQVSSHSPSPEVLEKKTRTTEHSKIFSMQQYLLIYPTYNYCSFI